MSDDSKRQPVVIVGCGCYSPVTYLHLRMFEIARDYLREQDKWDVLGGYLSPVSDFYTKEGLIEAKDRVEMCRLAVTTSEWIMVDPWETLQPDYPPTYLSLKHFDHCLNPPDRTRSGTSDPNNLVILSNGLVRVLLLAGSDLIESFGVPGVWAESHLHGILTEFGCLVIERFGFDVVSFIQENRIVRKYKSKLFVIKQTIPNDVSSTKVRLCIRNGQSIKYLLPDRVVDYISKNHLYQEK